MAKYTSGRQKNLKVGISSYSENLTSLEVIGNVGIATTNATSKLYVVGDGYFTGVITAKTFDGTVTYATNAGVATYTSFSGISTYSETAGIATYALSTGNVSYASTAGIATYATSAGVATYASFSGISTYSETAGIATYALSTGNVSYASTAGIATYATSAGVATYAITAGVATALQDSRTFEITGDILASPISFNGTGNVSLAATIQPNSVALGTDTFGDYVQSITGTTGQIVVTNGTGEGSTPVLSFSPNPTLGGNVTIGNDLQVNRNLNVTGNITVGGTTAYIIVQDFRITDADITLGFTTNISGNDVSTDTTANHGGIAIASTQGSPLVQLVNVAIGESLPATYKKFMWFKSGSFAGLNTDAWLSNYAIGIGSTQFPSGTRLAAGSVQFTERDLTVVRNINSSGIITGTLANSLTLNTSGTGLSGSTTYNNSGIATFTVTSNATSSNTSNTIVARNASGNFSAGTITANLTGTASTASFATTSYNLTDAANIITGTINSARLSGTYNVSISGNAATATYAGTSGIATYSGTAGIATYAGTAGIATYATSSGIATYAITAGVATYAGTAGIATYALSTGNVSYASTAGIATYATSSGIATYASFSGISTYSETAGIATYALSTGNVSYASTAGIATYATSSGIATYATNAGVATYAGTAGIATYALSTGNVSYASTAGIATYAGTSGVSTSVIGGISSVTRLQVTGISTFTDGPVLIGSATSTGTPTQRLQVTGDAYVSGSIGVGTTVPTEALSIFGKVQIQQNANSNNRLILRGTDGSSYRWNIDNYQSSNTFRIFREDDVTSANGFVAFSISTTGTVSATKFSGDGSDLTGLVPNTVSTSTATTPQFIGFLTTSSGITTTIQANSNLVFIPSSGNLGIGSTNPTSKLYVVGDTYITGILTANRIISTVYGEFLGGSISGTNIVGTSLSISGISTLGTIQVSSGIVTATSGIVTYCGDGSKLTGVIASSSIGIQDDGIQVGTATTIDFGSNLTVSSVSSGIATVTATSNFGLMIAATYNMLMP